MSDGRSTISRSPTVNAPHMTVEYGGHLFIANDTNQVNEHHTGQISTSPEVIQEWIAILDRRMARLQSLNIRSVSLLAPDKQTVFRHILPANYTHRPTEFLLNRSDVVDPSPILAQMSCFADVYPRSDSHWDHLGAYLTVEILRAQLNLAPLPTPISWQKETQDGDLGRKFTPPKTSEFNRASFITFSRCLYRNNIPNNGNIIVYSKLNSKENTQKPETKLILFGDRFSYSIIHFLREMFDIVVLAHCLPMDYRLIEIVQPTLVISEFTERFVTRLPSPGDGETLRAIWFEKATREEGMNQFEFIDRERVDSHTENFRIVEEIKAYFAPFQMVLAPAPKPEPETLAERTATLTALLPEIHALSCVDAPYKHRTSYWLEGLQKRLLPAG